MGIRTASAIALLAALLTAPGLSNAANGEDGRRNINPHDYSKEELCSVCHTAEPPQLLLDPVTICVKCHPGNIGNHPVTKHPMGVVPRIKVPSYLPLTEEGQIVCSTCHDPHNRTNHPDMLRADRFRLCGLCHVGY